MIDRSDLDKWARTHYSTRTQALVISFIAAQIDELEAFGCQYSMNEIIRQCQERHIGVSRTTMRRWWKLYIEWGELPYVVKQKQRKMREKMYSMGSRAAINDHELLQLKQIVDDNPNLYLDEISLRFGIKTGKYLCDSTIWSYLSGKLGYSLRVLMDVGKQRNKDDEIAFLNALNLRLQGCPERLVMIDKMHKDRNASRRKQG